MTLADLHIPYTLPAVLLLTAFFLKLPTFVRFWRVPDVRSTTLLLLLAAGVFVSVPPASIAAINRVTGVPNLAAPWVYSLLTAFCGSCLTMIITWREEPSPKRRRRVRLVWSIYLGIIVALWATFVLADTSVERIYDLDTYYANTPFMREHILLYLVAHMVSALVAAYMIWTWLGRVSAPWLRAGLMCLQMGYASGLVFDVTKLAAVGARWTDTNWDKLSTHLAPPFALFDAILVAIGFIIPQAGPYLQERRRTAVEYKTLYPLWRTLRSLDPAPARVRMGPLSPMDVRLLVLRNGIRDGLLRLLPYLDEDRRRHAHRLALAAGHTDAQATALAAAADITAAVNAFHASPISPEDSEDATHASSDLLDLAPISLALRDRATVDAIRRQAATTERAASLE